MKQIITLLLTVSVFTVQAQSLHGDMETWRNIRLGADTAHDPAGWFSADSLVLTAGPFLYPGAHFTTQVSQTSDAHSGNYAAKLVSKIQDSLGIAPALLSNAQPQVNFALFDPSNPFAALYFVGGTAVTQRITSISAWIKYLPQGSDYGEISIYATVPVAGGKDSIVGSVDTPIYALTTYAQVTAHITYSSPTVVPRKIFIQFLSSPMTGTPANGSTMYVDDVSMSTLSVPGLSAGHEGDVVACYPNPSAGIIHFDAQSKEPLQLCMYDLNGQLIAQKEVIGHSIFNFSYLPSGIYFYNLVNNAGLIVQRGKMVFSK